jgi:ubiquinone/menaquinone biosynthesis C-methylase UbiE
MIENRYDKELRKGNQLILDLSPANYALRIELAQELKNLLKNNLDSKILEIGSGEGHLTNYILKNNPLIKIDCLDISKEMIDSSKQILSQYINRINFINQDVVQYLDKINFKYDFITTAWTIHNFKWQDKKKTFEKIYSSLSSKGKFLLMDKLYPDNLKEKNQLLDLQQARYRYIDKKLAKAIVSHEKQDFLDDYRMDETQTIDSLKKIGFKKIKILDRVERDVLLVAEK